jgi:hypothetical protein
MADSIRESFEKWQRDELGTLVHFEFDEDGDYLHTATQLEWLAYRAGASEMKESRDELLNVLEAQVCPSCDHFLRAHIDRYGCEYELGDKWVTGSDGTECLMAQGPCGCAPIDLTEYPETQMAIVAIQKARAAAVRSLEVQK